MPLEPELLHAEKQAKAQVTVDVSQLDHGVG